MKKCILAILVMAVLVPAAQAEDDLAALKKKVKAQEDSIAQMKEQISAVEQRTGAAGGDNWWDRINWSGDFRYRHEMSNDEDSLNNAKGTQQRQRVRARIKMQAQVNEEVDVTVRLATDGSSGASATSTNQTLEGKLDSKEVWLDQMFMTYSPQDLEGFNVLAGKMANPFYRAGGNQLIWDSDVTPEGIVLQTTTELSEETSIGFNAGGIWLEELWASAGTSSTEGSDEYLWAAQLFINQALDATSSLTAGASYYDFVNVQNSGGYAAGNSEVSGLLANDYNLLEFFAALNTEVNGTPLSVYGSYVQNDGTESGYNQDTAYLLGLKVNKCTTPGTWQAGYEYRDVEADAVVGYFTNADSVGGGTTGQTGGLGSETHQVSYKHQLMKNVQGGVKYIMGDQIDSGGDNQDFNRLQLDLIVKFK
ncbi:MAG: putative porin [Phycisphaeraceae bacterium]|nr:putative porin [Phycisphaeraceae bacterium]